MEINKEKSFVNGDQNHPPLSSILCSSDQKMTNEGLENTNTTMIQCNFVESQPIIEQNSTPVIDFTIDQKAVDNNEDNTNIILECDLRRNIIENFKYSNQLQRTIGGSIPNLLYARQMYGSFGVNCSSCSNNDRSATLDRVNRRSLHYSTIIPTITQCNNQGIKYRQQKQHQHYLTSRYQDYAASRIAWSPQRMQNIILAVGQNTPATFCYTGKRDRDDSYEYEEDDDDDEEDDDRNVVSSVQDPNDDDEDDDAPDSEADDAKEIPIHDGRMSSLLDKISPTSSDVEVAPANTSDNDANDSLVSDGTTKNDINWDATDETKESSIPNSHITTTEPEPQSTPTAKAALNSAMSSSQSSNSTVGQFDTNSQAGDYNSIHSNVEWHRDSTLPRSIEEGDDGDAEDMEMAILRMLAAQDDGESTESSESYSLPSSRRNSSNNQHGFLSSIRHSGCINTACWLTCPWRISSSEKYSGSSNFLSTATSRSSSFSIVPSNECPTQIITSGDDKFIKFWDVRNSLGIASPLSGGYDTLCPYENYSTAAPTLEIGKEWRASYRKRRCYDQTNSCDFDEMHTRRPVVSGEVTQLASIHSGHRGNVFHVTPINERPGQILSCGADGFLRLVNLEKEESSIVISPFPHRDESSDDDDISSLLLRAGMSGEMAFSHVLLTANTGLLCSEQGLHLFDVRLSASQQQRVSLLQSNYHGDRTNKRSHSKSCKACAIWSPNGYYDSDPTYVFAGRAGPVVELFDIRMSGTNENRRKVIERYQPRQLQATDGAKNVSVSGLDVTKDGKELLVSYELDQIYTFPILHDSSSCPAGPTLDDIDVQSEKVASDPSGVVSEIAAYGGHLNRHTFLKSPKYAGPNDEYICTGSDSGHAWIYDKFTGTVASLLAVDPSICNGVIPHPTLPYFITYGIASTAKVWRACPPVASAISNSPTGMRRSFSVDKEVCPTTEYHVSPVTVTWNRAEKILEDLDRKEPGMLPDFIPCIKRKMDQFNPRSKWNVIAGPDSPSVGNSLQKLSLLLTENRFDCYMASVITPHRRPIEQPIIEFNHRVAINRLKTQATSLGATFNRKYPWMFVMSHHGECSVWNPADLVPDFPSDWILLDSKMSITHIDPMMNFNSTDYPNIVESEPLTIVYDVDINTIPWLSAEQRSIENYTHTLWPTLGSDPKKTDVFVKRSRKLLLETATVLKEAGNSAMKNGCFASAKKYYDKTIQYCAIVFMECQEGSRSLSHLSTGHRKTLASSGITVIAVWSPLLRLLITARLNMAFLFLKPEVKYADGVEEQVRHVLQLLDPFTRKEGQVLCGANVISKTEPSETYHEARSLQAKAYFRRGSAELETKNYDSAVKSFELSMKYSESSFPSQKPDSIIFKRLREAKRMKSNKKMRDRKRYQRWVLNDEDTSDNN